MMKPRSAIGRRRFMRIAAAAASLGPFAAASADPAPASWRGIVMGNLASIEIRHPDRDRALRLLAMAQSEIARLESILSLYRPDSALATLNRERVVRLPPLDLVQILSIASHFGAITEGRFDVTVQPLWTLYAAHFSQPGCDPAGPDRGAVERTVARVDYRGLEIEPSIVGLGREHMQVTLNGIAQGYITDRIVDLFRNEGLEHVLVDLGEIRAIGGRDRRQAWQAGIEDPRDKTSLVAEVPLNDSALATSGAYGFKFEPGGRIHHIFDPRTGSSPHLYSSVSVVAPDATTADALATAGNLMSPEAMAKALNAAGAERALLIDPDGVSRWISA